MKTIKQEEIEAFLPQIVNGHTMTVLWGNNMYIFTQAPEKGEESCLPHGLCMANSYTMMTTGSKHVAIVIKKQTAELITNKRAGGGLEQTAHLLVPCLSSTMMSSC